MLVTKMGICAPKCARAIVQSKCRNVTVISAKKFSFRYRAKYSKDAVIVKTERGPNVERINAGGDVTVLYNKHNNQFICHTIVKW